MQITTRPYAFSEPSYMTVAKGMSLGEMVEKVNFDANIPAIWKDDAIVLLDGEVISPDQWMLTFPHEGANVVINTSLHGGDTLRTILTIVVIVAAAWVTSGASGMLGTTIGAGGTAAATAGALVSVAGMLLVNAIAPLRPPALSGGGGGGKESPTYSLSGGQNNLRRFGTVPVVLGEHRHVPPLGSVSYTELIGNDEYLRMMVVWGYRPLLIENIQIGSTPIEDYRDFEIETVLGYSTEETLTLFPGVVYQEQIGSSLTHAGGWVQRTSQLNADELSVDIVYPRGLVVINTAGNNVKNTVQIESRFRKVGDSIWTDMIEEVSHDLQVVALSAANINTVIGIYIDIYTGVASYVEGGGDVSGKIKVGSVTKWRDSIDVIHMTVTNINAPDTTGFNVSLDVSLDAVVSAGTIKINMMTTTRASNSLVRVGYKWRVEKGFQYEVAIRRITADSSSTTSVSDCVWSVLRTVRNEQPVNFRQPLAMTAIRIKASEQLSGAISDLNATVTSIANIWDGNDWDNLEPTNNPAALIRLVLMGPANSRARSEAQVDQDNLSEFYDFCEANGYAFNMVRDFQASIWDTIADIAAAGRGAPTLMNGKWAIIWDTADKPVAQHFTPRNSWGFGSSKNLIIKPHAWRARFINENEEFKQDEMIIYDDGYTSANATRFEGIEFPGITNPDLVWKFGRFQIAQLRLRPEEYTFNCDFEHLACQRGQIILVGHDVTMWGLAWGRVKELIMDGPDIAGVIVDEKFPMEAEGNYNIRFRLQDGSSYVREVVTEVGENTELTFTEVTSEEIQVDDLAMFGEVGTETQRLLVKSIDRSENFNALLTCVDEGPAIYSADSGEIPEFISNITEPIDVTQIKPNVPQIVSVESGTSALLLVGNSLVSRIIVNVVDSGGNVSVGEFQIRYREQGNVDWLFASTSVENKTFDLWPVTDSLIYDIQARSIGIDYGVASNWSDVQTVTVIGQTEIPPDVTGFAVNVVGSNSHISWDDVAIADLSHYRLRWSPLKVGATWNGSVDVVSHVTGTSVTLPAQVGTYLIKAYDRLGNESENAAIISTNIAKLIGLNIVETITEQSPTFNGVKDGVYYDSDFEGLILGGAGDLYDVTDLYTIGDLYLYGGLLSEGHYYLENGIDLGDVFTSRISASLSVVGVNLLQDLYNAADLYDYVDLYEDVGEFGAGIEIRFTDDDPTGTPTWSSWTTLIVGDYTTRAYEIRVKFEGDGVSITPLLSAVSFTVDMPDRIFKFSANILSGGTRVDFSPAFYVFPDDEGLGISVIDGQEGDNYVITNINETGFDIAFTNSGGPVARRISGIAQSYGEVTV